MCRHNFNLLVVASFLLLIPIDVNTLDASELEIYAQRVEEWETKYQAELQVGFKDQPVQLQHHDRHTLSISQTVLKTHSLKVEWPEQGKEPADMGQIFETKLRHILPPPEKLRKPVSLSIHPNAAITFVMHPASSEEISSTSAPIPINLVWSFYGSYKCSVRFETGSILIHSETQNEGKLFYENNELNIMEAKQPCPKGNDEQQSIYGCAILSTRRVEAGAITVRFGHGQKKDESPGLKAMMGRLERVIDRDQIMTMDGKIRFEREKTPWIPLALHYTVEKCYTVQNVATIDLPRFRANNTEKIEL